MFLTICEDKHSGSLYCRVHGNTSGTETKFTMFSVEQILNSLGCQLKRFNPVPHSFRSCFLHRFRLSLSISSPSVLNSKLKKPKHVPSALKGCFQIRAPPNRQTLIGRLVFPGKILAFPLYFFKNLT